MFCVAETFSFLTSYTKTLFGTYLETSVETLLYPLDKKVVSGDNVFTYQLYFLCVMHVQIQQP